MQLAVAAETIAQPVLWRQRTDVFGIEGLPTLDELAHHASRGWCLDPFPTVGSASLRLREALSDFSAASGWRKAALAQDVFIFNCGLLSACDDLLRGRVLRARRRLAKAPAGRRVVDAIEALITAPEVRQKQDVRRWRDGLRSAFNPFLVEFARDGADGERVEASSLAPLTKFLQVAPPSGLGERTISVASCFRRLDMTPADFLELANRATLRRSDRALPILVLGLRTSGSYMAPLARARLEALGYADVAELTVHPDKGASRGEAAALRAAARAGRLVAIFDDAPQTGATAVRALDLVRTAGFPAARMLFCAPTHPASREWARTLPPEIIVTLDPDEWSQRRFLDGTAVQTLLQDYARAAGCNSPSLTFDAEVDAVSRALAELDGVGRGARLKRVFALSGTGADGNPRVLRVLAKSVGWGWLGDAAFTAGVRLAGSTPVLLGARHGFLFTEWSPQAPAASDLVGTAPWVDAASSYIAARVQQLALTAAITPERGRKAPRNGRLSLEKSLSHAFGRAPANLAWRGWLKKRLESLPRGPAIWIDGAMAREEWILDDGRWLKSDFEHHGLGKAEINETDPACDLAGALLAEGGTHDAEDCLIARYVARTGDVRIRDRLFIAKLLIGVTTMEREASRMEGRPESQHWATERHDRLIEAWHYLTVQAARQCGAQLGDAPWPDAGRKLVALDVDGVLDRRIFGFPTATAASLRALARFKASGIPVLLNTARSLDEVREYCSAYGFRGGVAEYGACLWDAATGRETVLCSDVALQQLGELRRALRSAPVIRLDARYKYSIRAYLYRPHSRGGLAESLSEILRSHTIGALTPEPIPRSIVASYLSSLKLDRLRALETSIDTTVVVNEVDKGSGLRAFRERLKRGVEVVAVGDSASDLPMFREADSAFAPGHIGCRREAALAGVRIVPGRFQNGLEQISVAVTGMRKAPTPPAPSGPGEALFFTLLKAADRSTAANLAHALRLGDAYAWAFR